MGGPAKKWSEAEGKMKAVPGCQIFIGGTIGATKPTLSLNTIPTLALITTPTHRHGDTAPALALSFALALALALALTKPSGEPKDPHPTLTRPPLPMFPSRARLLPPHHTRRLTAPPLRSSTPLRPPPPPSPPPAGEDGELAMDAAVKGIPLDSDDLIPVLTEIAVKHFHGTVNAEFVADQAAWEKACSRHAPAMLPTTSPCFPCDLPFSR